MYLYSELLVEQDEKKSTYKNIIDIVIKKAKETFSVKQVLGTRVLGTAAKVAMGGKVDMKDIGKMAAEIGIVKIAGKCLDSAQKVIPQVETFYTPISITPSGQVKEDITLTEEELQVLTEAEENEKTRGILGRVTSKLINIWRKIAKGGLITMLIFIIGITLFVSFVLAVVSESVYRRFIDFTKWLERVAIPKAIRIAGIGGTHIVEKYKTEKGEEKTIEEPWEGEVEVKRGTKIELIHRIAIAFHNSMYLLRKYVSVAFNAFKARKGECKSKEKFFEKLWCYIKTYFASIKAIVSKSGGRLKVVEAVKILIAPILFFSLLLGRPIAWVSNLFKGKEQPTQETPATTA